MGGLYIIPRLGNRSLCLDKFIFSIIKLASIDPILLIFSLILSMPLPKQEMLTDAPR